MQNPNPSEVLFVLGMHRSGTSALSRVLNLLGYAAPKTLMKSNKSNVTGHWESTPIGRLNDDILEAGGLVWSDWSLGRIETIRSHARDKFEADILKTVSAEFARGRPAIVKDPRICRLFELYKSALAKEEIPLCIVIPIRNPLAVAESLKKRNGISELNAVLLWLRHVLDATQNSEGQNRVFVTYEDFLADPVKSTGEIIDRLSLETPYPLDSVGAQISSYIDDDLQHHNFGTIDVAHNPLTEGWISDAYQALLVLSKDPNAKHALNRLSDIKAEFDQSNEILTTVSTELTNVKDGLAQERDSLIEQLRANETELTRYRDQINEANAHLSIALSESSDWQNRFDTLQKANTKIETKLDQSRQAREADAEIKADLEDNIRQLNRLVCAKQEELIDLQASLDEAKDRHQRDLQLTAELEERITTLASQTTRAAEGYDERQKELRQLERQFWRLKDELRWSKEIIRNYQNSTSWKVTAPLRTAARFGQRIKSRLHAKPAQAAAKNQTIPESPKAEQPPMDKAAELEARQLTPRDGAIQTDRKSSSSGRKLAHDIGLLERSESFDKAFYLAHYPEAALHSKGPEGHYLLEGWKLGNRPNPTFETTAYLSAHPELVDTDTCPLIHFIKTSDRPFVNSSSSLNGAPANLTKKNAARIAVFTAISGGYDNLKEPDILSENTDYYVFTDENIPAYSNWKPVPFEFVSHDPTRTARFVKTHPHLYFDEYDWAIWIDANLQLATKAEDLIPADPSKADIYTWSHPLRTCVYQEAEECIKRKKDDSETIKLQIKSLRDRKFPEEAGLFETSVMVSRMGNEKVKEFFNVWWREISQWSRRDQLSLPYVISSTGVNVGLLAREKICMRTDPRFVYYRHSAN